MSGAPGSTARARTTVRALALLAAVGATLPSTAARAQEPHIEFTVRPAHVRTDDSRTNAWLIHRGKPGTTIRDAVLVQNLGTVPLDLILYPADAHSTDEGEFGLEPIEDADDGVAGWVSVARGEVSLEPGETEEVPVVIRVPRDATPGDHPGAVVARTAEPIRQGDVPTLLAVGARLYVRVPGPLVERVTLHGVEAAVEEGRPRFDLDLENTGNTIVEVTGSYTVEGLFGLDSSTGTIDHPITLLPGARVHPVVSHPDRLLGGGYRAEFDLTYGDSRALRGAVEFSAGFAWPLVALIAVIVAAITAVIARVRRSRRQSPPPTGNGHRPFRSAARSPVVPAGRDRR